ncbi:unnamed protein product, partial [Phaeothamnion confervicola]
LSKVAVVAVGGNALIVDSQHQSIEDQYQAVVSTTRHLVDLIQDGWTLVLTHGNGPQVGFILQRSELARQKVHPIPMHVAVADTQGAIGYFFQQALSNEFAARKMDRRAVTLVTQVIVDVKDPAFQNPTKPIGGFMDEATARSREREDDWNVVEDSGRGWRRVVASPKPQRILELDAIDSLIKSGFMVVAVGGGGIPVVTTDDGYRGVAAVIDKDLASSLLAQHLKSEMFMVSTAVEAVCINFGTPQQQELRDLSLADARRYLAEGHFKAGSMKPKVEAAIAYVEATGGLAVITNP